MIFTFIANENQKYWIFSKSNSSKLHDQHFFQSEIELFPLCYVFRVLCFILDFKLKIFLILLNFDLYFPQLCQSLMDRQVFCSISNRTSEIKKMFDDSHSKLYRFVGMDPLEGLENSNSTIIETSSSDEEHDYSIMEDCRGNQSIR